MYNDNKDQGDFERNLINTAYSYCRNRDFEEAYSIIKNFVKKYRISFYPIICLNLEKYDEVYQYYKSTFQDESVKQINLGDDQFIQKCAYSMVLCIKAFEFQKEMEGAFNIFDVDENKEVSINEYCNLIDSANIYLRQGNYIKAREHFKSVLKMNNLTPSIWLDLAETYHNEITADETHFNLIEAYMALKSAVILEESDEETHIFGYDFRLHYKMIFVLLHLKSVGLEQPQLLFNEISKLKASASSQQEINTAVQLEINIKGIERDFPF